MARRTRVGLGIGLALTSVSIVCWFPLEAALAFLSDDAYYYLKIARFITEGRGSTFDGIASTNGYHPLWMICVVAIQAVSWGGLVVPAMLMVILCGFLGFATLCLVYSAVEAKLAPGFGWVAVAACLLPNLFTAMTNGLETSLLLFSLSLLLWACCRWQLHSLDASPRRRFGFGLLLGFAFLSRLDSAFLVIAAGFLNLVVVIDARMSALRVMKALAPVVAGFALVTTPFLAWILINFGHLMPISGSLKSSFPVLREPPLFQYDEGFGLALLLAAAGLVVWNLRQYRRQGTPYVSLLNQPVPMLVLGSALHFAHAFLFLAWGVYWWHFVMYGLTLSLAVAQSAALLTARYPSARVWLAGALALGVGGLAVVLDAAKLQNAGERHYAWVEGARWARQNTSPDDVIAIKDAGLFGYFSERTVVNLDGKANSYLYREYLQRGAIDEYLVDANASYVADIGGSCKAGQCRIVIPGSRRPFVKLYLDRDQVVYRSPPVPRRMFDSRPPGHFTIWSYPSSSR